MGRSQADLVDDSIFTEPDSVEILVASELLARKRGLSDCGDCIPHAFLHISGQCPQFSYWRVPSSAVDPGHIASLLAGLLALDLADLD